MARPHIEFIQSQDVEQSSAGTPFEERPSGVFRRT